MSDKVIPAHHKAAYDALNAMSPGDMPLVFIVPLNQVEKRTAIDKTTKEITGEFINLPYSVKGTFGAAPAYIRGGRLTIPATDTPKTPKAKKDGSPLDAQAAARLGVKL